MVLEEVPSMGEEEEEAEEEVVAWSCHLQPRYLYHR
jgi:hypothetical protein